MSNFNIVIAQKGFEHGLNKPTIFLLNQKEPLNQVYDFIQQKNIKIIYIFGQSYLRIDRTIIRVENIYNNTQEHLIDIAKKINIDMFINLMNAAIISIENKINDGIRLFLIFLKQNGEKRDSCHDYFNKLSFKEKQEMEKYFLTNNNFLSNIPENINKTNVGDSTRSNNNNNQIVVSDYDRILNTQQQAITQTYASSQKETQILIHQNQSSIDSSLSWVQPYVGNGQNQNSFNLEEYEKKYLYNDQNQNQQEIKQESKIQKIKIVSENYMVVSEDEKIKQEIESKPNLEKKQKIKIISEDYIVAPEFSQPNNVINSSLQQQYEEIKQNPTSLNKQKLPSPIRFSSFIPQNGFQCMK